VDGCYLSAVQSIANELERGKCGKKNGEKCSIEGMGGTNEGVDQVLALGVEAVN
jgi:hypothetical protein